MTKLTAAEKIARKAAKEAETVRARHAAMLDALKEARAEWDARNVLKVSISKDNSKMGPVPSVSLLPLVTCPACCWDTCAGKCYALKIAAIPNRKNVRRAYARNTVLAVENMPEYFRQINLFVAGVRFFRWHVSGDIPGGECGKQYFTGMIETARNNPVCTFLAFTKNAAVVNAWIDSNGALPENLKVIFSNWGRYKLNNPHGLPVSEVVFAGEGPAPDWNICGGNCYECACRGVGCWQLKNGETIAFSEH